jgi:DNA-binding MarR family transcriptional regulator
VNGTDPASLSIREALNRKALASARHRAAVGRMLRVSDSEMLAIMHVGRAGQLTPGALGHLLALTSGGTTALVQRLERDGHLIRERHPRDGRSSLLRLSPDTERRALEAMAPLVTELDELIGALPEVERETIAAFLSEVAGLTERQADETQRRADGQSTIRLGEPVPGLWA